VFHFQKREKKKKISEILNATEEDFALVLD